MINMLNTILIDMYGVIIKESRGNFTEYTFNHFDESHHGNLHKLLDDESIYTKAGLGEFSSTEFLKMLGYENPEASMKDYLENNLTLDEGFIDFAEQIKDKYDLVLLSNDVGEWSRHITSYFGIDKYFKDRIISSEVKCRKPDFKIYDTALEKIGKKPQECIFIDNKPENLLAAEEVGIAPIHFNRDGGHYCGMTVFCFEELTDLLK